MSPPPNCGAGAQRLGLLPTDDGRNHAPPDKTIIGFLGQLDIAVAGTNMRQLLANELKDSAREVSDDLVAVTCPNGMALIPGPDAMARFWNVVLDIILEYKKKRRVFQCLAAILDKIHCTTNVLRRLSPVVDDFPEVEKLHQTVICLISCATPQPFLIICHRSPNPNKLVHLPEVQRNLRRLSEHVGLLQRNAHARKVDAMGCSGSQLFEVFDASFA